ncbi:MAG: response regulator transcription factor [Chloroflexota bacterium]
MTRVVIADDHPLMRGGIRLLLEQESDMEVVGEAADGEEAVRLAVEKGADVVLMDIEMPGVDGLEATRRLQKQRPEAKVLALTIHGEPEYVEGLLAAGAHGYLLKSSSDSVVKGAVRLVSLGEMVLDWDIVRPVAKRSRALGAEQVDVLQKGPVLTERQLLVLKWISGGMANREIAQRLGVAERTAKLYVSELLEKFDVQRRSALAGRAIRLGILDISDM